MKDRFSEFVDRVDREHECIVITRNGRPAAVLIGPDDLDSLEETPELLGDHDAIRELVEAEAAVAAGRRGCGGRRWIARMLKYVSSMLTGSGGAGGCW